MSNTAAARRYYWAHRDKVLAAHRARYVPKPRKAPLPPEQRREARLLSLRKYYLSHIPETRAYYVAHKVEFRDRQRTRESGVTPEYFAEMLDAQGGCCAICGSELEPPQGRGDAHADHNHATKQPRGVLCHCCNTGLGLFRDSAETLRLAAEYLDSYGD